MEEKSENTKNLSKQMLRRASTGMIMDFLQKPCKEYDAWLEGAGAAVAEIIAQKLVLQKRSGLSIATVHQKSQ